MSTSVKCEELGNNSAASVELLIHCFCDSHFGWDRDGMGDQNPQMTPKSQAS